jgi:hypothetical protein
VHGRRTPTSRSPHGCPSPGRHQPPKDNTPFPVSPPQAEIPEPVDTIISEPLGIMLVNERMLESYIAARKWLKPDGIMLPTTSTLFACPFSDAQLYLEVRSFIFSLF